jgi:ribosomal protein S18 acetylase RimI-like enzyme
MDSIQIIKIAIDHLVQLQEIGSQTFRQTFSSSNTEENIKIYLEESFSIKKLTAELLNVESVFYFATLNGTVIGYLKLNFGQAQTENQGSNSLEIERIYVLHDFHEKKVGQLLFDHAIQIARNKNISFVWLGVWEKNSRAIRFYIKNGFVEFDKHFFVLGNENQTDIMMKLVLGYE